MEKRELSYQVLAEFCQKLALFAHSGIYHGQGLLLMAQEEREKNLKLIYTQLARQADYGLPLSACLSEVGIFPAYMIGMIKTGEETGHLEEALQELSKYYYERFQMGKQIRSAIVYPAVMVLLMIVVIGILLVKVLPIFEQVYRSLGSGLNGMAGGLLQIGQSLNEILPFLLVALCCCVCLVLLYACSGSFRVKIVKIYQKHWGDKGIAKQMNDVHFLQGLAMAKASGLNMMQGIDSAQKMLEESPHAMERCKLCNEKMQAGMCLEDALVESGFLTVSRGKLLLLAQSAGNGDAMLNQIAAQMAQETQENLANKVESIEPCLVLITAFLVGVILLSVMLPLMNIMALIG